MILEEKIRLRKYKLQKLYEDMTESKGRYTQQISGYKNEQLNQAGVSNNAELTVIVITAKDFLIQNFDGKSNSYVVIKLDNQKQTTTIQQKKVEPVWNEEFSFKPNSKDQILQIEIWDRGDFQDVLVGLVKLSLRDYESQNKIDRWLNLYNPQGARVEGSIRLKIQFFWSKLVYYQGLIDAVDKKMEMIHESINELNKYFKLFEKPFGLIMYLEIEKLEELENKLFDKQMVEEQSRKTVFITGSQLRETNFNNNSVNIKVDNQKVVAVGYSTDTQPFISSNKGKIRI